MSSITGHTMLCPKHPPLTPPVVCTCGWDATSVEQQAAFKTIKPGHTLQCPKSTALRVEKNCTCGQGEGRHTLLCPKGPLISNSRAPLCNCGSKEMPIPV